MAVDTGTRKASLDRYLRLVRAGQSVIVVEAGRPVAILSPVEDRDERI